MSPLTRLDIALSAVPPLGFIFAYLLAIPAFGLLYMTICPQGFYAPYLRHEPAAKSDQEQLRTILARSIRRAFSKLPAERLTLESWMPDLDSVQIEDLNSTDGSRLSFRVRLLAAGTGAFSGSTRMFRSSVLSLPEQSVRAESEHKNGTFFYHFPDRDAATFSVLSLTQADTALQSALNPGESESGVLPIVLVDREEQVFQRVLQGAKGDMSGLSGHFWRMTYMSAVVITTLGLGDILPMSPTARLFVAFEAVLGIILTGLFLNSLAYRASRRLA